MNRIFLQRIHAAEKRIDDQPARHAQEDDVPQRVPAAKAVRQRHAGRVVAWLPERERVLALAEIAAVGFLQREGFRRDAGGGDGAGAVDDCKRGVLLMVTVSSLLPKMAAQPVSIQVVNISRVSFFIGALRIVIDPERHGKRES